MGRVIAERKRKENIAEYIVHMYQTEDLIRAYDFHIDEVEQYVIAHIPESEEDQALTKSWYSALISRMKEEGLDKKGHLLEVNTIVEQLQLLHEELQDSNEAYKTLLQEAAPHLEEFHEMHPEKTTDVQLCLNAIYGLLMLRLNNRPVSDKQLKSVEVFGALLSYLSYVYRQKEMLPKN
jgi:hypothetical protein